MGEVKTVVWKKHVAQQLSKLPVQIERKFYAWVSAISLAGIRETRKSPGFHDEPLKGSRLGQRSVRLNKAYRANYEERTEGVLELIEVIEVNKHEY